MEQLSNWGFALFSAHIHRFLPHIPWDGHPELYKQWACYHRPKPIHTEDHWDTSHIAHLIDSRPRIICLYHLGYHAQIPLVLKDMGLYFDLILDRNVYEKQRVRLDEMKHYMQAQGKNYRFLMSDDPRVLLQVRSAIRDGKHILVFADGNSGATDDLAAKVKVEFLSSTLLVRQGIARISHLLQVPIVPLSHESAKDTNVLRAGRVIYPLPENTPEEYVKYSMSLLYRYLAQQVRKYPPVWESWGYLDQLQCLDIAHGQALSERPPAGHEACIRLNLMGRAGYFDRERYRFYY